MLFICIFTHEAFTNEAAQTIKTNPRQYGGRSIGPQFIKDTSRNNGIGRTVEISEKTDPAMLHVALKTIHEELFKNSQYANKNLQDYYKEINNGKTLPELNAAALYRLNDSLLRILINEIHVNAPNRALIQNILVSLEEARIHSNELFETDLEHENLVDFISSQVYPEILTKNENNKHEAFETKLLDFIKKIPIKKETLATETKAPLPPKERTPSYTGHANFSTK